jgi:integrase
MANYADSTRTPRTLTEREQKLLLKVTGEHRAGYRDHVLYAMALGTGLREHELIALSVGDMFRDGRPKRRLLLSVFKGAGTLREPCLEHPLGRLRERRSSLLSPLADRVHVGAGAERDVLAVEGDQLGDPCPSGKRA